MTRHEGERARPQAAKTKKNKRDGTKPKALERSKSAPSVSASIGSSLAQSLERWVLSASGDEFSLPPLSKFQLRPIKPIIAKYHLVTTSYGAGSHIFHVLERSDMTFQILSELRPSATTASTSPPSSALPSPTPTPSSSSSSSSTVSSAPLAASSTPPKAVRSASSSLGKYAKGSQSDPRVARDSGSKTRRETAPAPIDSSSSGSGSGRTVAAGAPAIAETNVGHRLLRSMGWGGGSLASSSGVALVDPLEVEVRTHRGGIGFERSASGL